jgi:hypothetical protein
MTNPASSGGAGSVFEAKVGASYLLSMLLEVEARGLPGCHMESVRLQRAEEGFPLDDIVVHGVNREGVTASIEIQVKRTLTFTASDKEFKDVVRQIGAAVSRENLGKSQHGFGIAIGRTRQSKEPFYQDVLKWARNLEDAVALRSRLERPGAAGLPDVLYQCGVSVAQFSLSSDSCLLGRGEVGSAKRFPLLHAPCGLGSSRSPALAGCIPARSVV